MPIKKLFTALVFLSFTGAASAKPNILLVIADDMGVDASPCYSVGSNSAKMPVLSKICSSGMVFENAYASPTCSPTRAGIMTGKHGFRTGVGGAITPQNQAGLSSSETSLFDVLTKGRNYESAVIGKWHLAPHKSGLNHPKSLGVSHFFGIYSGAAKDYYSWRAVDNGKPVTINNYATSEITDRAVDWIAKQKGKPWFLWLAYNAPHTPFHAPPSELHSYSGLGGTKAQIRKNRERHYFAALQALDTKMGHLLGSLSANDRKNTIVIFIGDNGSPFQVVKDIYGNRGAKGSIFEGGIHVPMVISGPGIKKGRTEALATTTDLFATIAGLAGLKAKSGTDSIDLGPVLRGNKAVRSAAYVEHFGNSAVKGKGSYGWMIRDARYKLVQPDGKNLMMFDLKTDPFEKRNLLATSLSTGAETAKARLLSNYATLHK